MQNMQDDSDLTDADRIHEGYQQRYQKERRASYALALFGILAIVAVVLVMFMHRYVNTSQSNLVNIEPAAGTNPQSLGTPSMAPEQPGTNTFKDPTLR